MSNGEFKKTMRDKIMHAIRERHITMKPRWHFILKSTLYILGGVLVLLFLLYLASFIFFVLRVNGTSEAPFFGFRGWLDFLRYLPWALILLTIIFIGILEVLVKKFSFAHQKPLVYSAVGIILLVFLGGLAVAQTSLHEYLFMRAREGGLPGAGGFYRHFGPEHPGMPSDIHPGRIIQITPSGFILEDPFGSTSTVVITADTELPSASSTFAVRDSVVVLGDGTSTIQAASIQPGYNRPFFGPAHRPHRGFDWR